MRANTQRKWLEKEGEAIEHHLRKTKEKKRTVRVFVFFFSLCCVMVVIIVVVVVFTMRIVA